MKLRGHLAVLKLGGKLEIKIDVRIQLHRDLMVNDLKKDVKKGEIHRNP